MIVPDNSPGARKERGERLARLLSNPETMDTIYEHVANGGTLIGLCETWDVRYSEVMKFIDADPERQKKYKDSIMARNEWSDEMLLAEVRAITQIDIRQLYEKDGTLKNIADLDAATARLVSSVEVHDLFEGRGDEREKVGEVKKVKLWDKLKALEMGLKNRRLLVDRSESDVNVKLEDLVGRSMIDPAPASEPKKAEAAKPEAESPANAVTLPAPSPAPLPAPVVPEKAAEAAPAPVVKKKPKKK